MYTYLRPPGSSQRTPSHCWQRRVAGFSSQKPQSGVAFASDATPNCTVLVLD